MAINTGDILESTVIWADIAVDMIKKVYEHIFPEYPIIGLFLIIISLFAFVRSMTHGHSPGAAFKNAIALFIGLTVLAFFLHLLIKLFLMMQNHTLYNNYD